MTEYQKLIIANQVAHTIEIIEPMTGKTGVVSIYPFGIAVFYGAIDGTDDKIVSPQEFNRNFKITAAIMG